MFSLIPLCSHAQILVNGKVTDDSSGEGLPGVNVVVKGTTTGSVTDIDGAFRLSIESGESVLVFSSVGFLSQEITVGSQTTFNVSLVPDIQQLEEIVVIGYGEMKKSDLSGASVSLDSKDIDEQAAVTLEQALQGRAAGVFVTSTSGQPGSSVSMRIRGTNTINSDAEPLYVIDGVPMGTTNVNNYDIGLGGLLGGGKSPISGLAGLNPNDIESIEILKDASATAIYGSRGANGVVLITTKRGKAGKAKFSYDGYYGVQEIPKTLDMMNLQQYAVFSNAFNTHTDRIPVPEFADPSLLGNGTDWQNAVFQSAPMQSHQLSASGGTEQSKYAVSVGYLDQDGIAVSSGFKRLSTRVNLNSKLNDWLTLNANIAYSRTDEDLNNFNGEGGTINAATQQPPNIPVTNPDGSYASGTGQYARVNPIALAELSTNELKRDLFNGNLGLDFDIVKGLVFHTRAGGNVNYSDVLTFSPTYDFGPQAQNNTNSVSHNKSQNSFWQLQNYFTYSKLFADKHDFTLTVGHEASEWAFTSTSGGGTDLPSNDIPVVGLSDPETRIAGFASSSGALQSFYGRLMYNYDGRYFLTLTARRDGSSNFGPQNRYANFPAIAASWRVSDEQFLSGISAIDNLKVRAGWGITGNQNIPGFRYDVSMATLPTGLGQGFRVRNYANPAVRWEESKQINVGFDLDLFDSRIGVIFDWYDKRNTDMLMEFPFPAYMGGVGNDAFRLQNPWGNFGEIKNTGFEITLNADIIRGNDFTWNSSLIFSQNHNELVDLGLGDRYLDSNIQWFTHVSRVGAGDQIGSFYGYKVAGIFQDKNDIINSPRQYELDGENNPILNRANTVWVGDLKFEDINGDGVIDDGDKTYLGSPQPKFTGGFNNTFSYKGFELNLFLQGSYGNKVYNFTRQGRASTDNGLDDMSSAVKNQLTSVSNFADYEMIDPNKEYAEDEDWRDDIDNIRLVNPGTDMPRITANDPNNNQRVSDRYIEDGSYLRIQNVSLSYTFPKQWLGSSVGLKIYTVIRNVYTFSNYSGYDPEIGQDRLVSTLYGVDNGRYPTPRIYTFGANLNF